MKILKLFKHKILLNNNMSVKYIDIDSTYRNRNMYPDQSNFVIPISFEQNPVTNSFYVQDPIVNAVPFIINTLPINAPSATSITLAASSSTIDNFYVDDILQIGTEFRKILSYDATTKTATVETPGFVGPPLAGAQYLMRKGLPFYTGQVGAAPTVRTINLNGLGTASPIDNFYTGKYIYFLPGGAVAGQLGFITAYNGTTKIASLATPLTVAPGVGDNFEIDELTRDNFVPLLYSGSQGFNQTICYTMDLLYITIPNILTTSGYGGTLDKYPYLYLHLYNEGAVMRSDGVLYSNNINAKGATFKIPLGLNLRQETFFTLKDAKMIQTTKFKPDLPIRFKLTLPNGEPITFTTPDNFSPLEPNPLLQISATFAIRRMDGN